jgi:RES domain-containing protein
LYCSESIPLAFLESMIRRQGSGFNHDYNIIVIQIPAKLTMQFIKPDKLENDWRSFKDYSICRKIGNEWFDKFDFPVLTIPSAVIPESYNYVINTQHVDFKYIKVIGATDLVPDPRLDEILRTHKN